MPGVKHSRQRDALLNNLRLRYDHPTAEELYMSLKSEMPNISLGTIYRNLNLLSDDGTILKISDGGVDHFDAHTHEHYHMLCTECKHVYDVDMPVIEGLNEQAQKYVNGTVNAHFLLFNGVCENCQNKK